MKEPGQVTCLKCAPGKYMEVLFLLRAGRQADAQRDRVENNKTRQRTVAAALITGCSFKFEPKKTTKNCHRHLCFPLLLSFVLSGGDGEKEHHASFAHQTCVWKHSSTFFGKYFWNICCHFFCQCNKFFFSFAVKVRLHHHLCCRHCYLTLILSTKWIIHEYQQFLCCSFERDKVWWVKDTKNSFCLQRKPWKCMKTSSAVI